MPTAASFQVAYVSHPPQETSHRGVFREPVRLKLCESRDAERNVRNGWEADVRDRALIYRKCNLAPIHTSPMELRPIDRK